MFLNSLVFMRYSFHKSFLFFKGLNLYLFFFLFLMSCSPDSEDLPSSFEVSVLVDGNGTVSSSQFDVLANNTISITATPNEGYYFDRWKGLGEVNESETLNLLVYQAYDLTAVFLPFPILNESVEVYDPKKIDSSPSKGSAGLIKNFNKCFSDFLGSIVKTSRTTYPKNNIWFFTFCLKFCKCRYV